VLRKTLFLLGLGTKGLSIVFAAAEEKPLAFLEL
jgi:hypothetical protein